MTKRILTLVMASCALSSSIGAVHEMRTPISLLSKLDNINGSFHFPVARVKPVLFETASVNFWSGAYHRTAYDALCPKRCDSCCSLGEYCEAANCSYNFFGDVCGCNGSSSSSCGCTSCARDGLCGINTGYNGCVSCPNKKVPLAQLIFGKAVFGGQEAFSPDTDFRKHNYLLTGTSIIAPKLDYKEEGVVLGMHAEHQVYDTKWRVGFNAALPIKNIEVTAHYNCDSVTWNGISYIDWPELFFNEYGVRLCDTEHVVGFGDLETALVLGYDFTDRLYAEVVGEIKFPTGKRNLCPGRVYYVPAGNNGHFEAKIGLDAGWRSKKWVGITADAAFASVMSAVEKKAAQFKCATVRGIGPCVDAKIQYNYLLGHLDLTVFHPENQDLGFAVGYEVYYKMKDKAVFCTCNGADRAEAFLSDMDGVLSKPINPAVMVKDTDILSHKVRGQVFTRWDYLELYAGASKVVGGFNAMVENELFVGCDINF